jgi:hypothetical protein
VFARVQHRSRERKETENHQSAAENAAIPPEKPQAAQAIDEAEGEYDENGNHEEREDDRSPENGELRLVTSNSPR